MIGDIIFRRKLKLWLLKKNTRFIDAFSMSHFKLLRSPKQMDPVKTVLFN